MEAKLSMEIDHPNIIKCFSSLQCSKFYYLVFEYCVGGDLQSFLGKNNGLDIKDALSVMKQIRDAYKFLF